MASRIRLRVVLIAGACALTTCQRDSRLGPDNRPVLSVNSTTPNLKVAFIGDQGNGPAATTVLQLIRDEGADLVLHQGDFDYADNPTQWDATITNVLGADFPYFAAVGNHDAAHFYGPGGYQEKLAQRLARVPGATCTGDLGVNSTCRYQGLFFILSGAGTLGTGHEAYIRQELAADNSVWRICSWHKNQAAMQVGGKTDAVGWGPYEACRQLGAVIATAHEHSYERTKTLVSTELQTVDPAWPAPGSVRVAPGASFVVVSGLGGASIRDQERCLPTTYPYGCNGEWASIYTSNQGAKFGALFIEFNVDADPYKARGYFKNIDRVVVEEFTVTSQMITPDPTNAAPVVDAGPDQSADEGASVPVSASFTDGDVTDVHTATISWGDGSADAGVVGEGNGSGTVNGSHVYRDNGAFIVTVTVDDGRGGVGTDNLTVTVSNLPPTVLTAGGPYSGVEGTAISLSGSASDPGAADVLTFEWDLQYDGVFDGDATGPTVQHVYQEGAYIAALRVRDDDGGISEVSTTNVSVGDADPVAAFSYAPASPVVNQPVAFTDASTSADGIVSRQWSFGDGASSTGQNPTHTYAAAGTYTVTLTVQEGDKDAATAQRQVVVKSVVLYFSVENDGAVGGLSVANEDIVAFDGANFSLFFDGSDVGIGGFTLDAFSVVSPTEILMSFTNPGLVPGVSGTVDDSDILKFTATSLGANTAGSFTLYFDGSDVGLTENGEDVDAVELVDGRLLISTTGAFVVPGVSGDDEDVLAFTPTTLGDATSGTWALYFDGSDVGLTAGSEDVDALAVDAGGKLYLSTTGAFAVTGVSGAGQDVFVFTPTSLGANTQGTYAPFFRGSLYGLSRNVFAIDLP